MLAPGTGIQQPVGLIGSLPSPTSHCHRMMVTVIVVLRVVAYYMEVTMSYKMGTEFLS